ncbi:NAD(P)H-hydrate epimerase [Lentibacillus sp. CBA3610]|uniref:NAD(P)H-hydrate epimerase n=1 Tax=Lentibacillus sp. CBA3610 TaxID=2518176 RepID=UPI001595E04D|nr:NAD(P)H-hydrate epimerase [Lentibacillus sp. CBA3610]
MRQIPEIEVLIRETDVMVDAILGIGTTGMLRQPLNEIVTRINQADAYVIFN